MLSNCQGITPIGWSDELLDGRIHYNIIRVEIIVDYPSNIDIASLSVVDPQNSKQPGFLFAEIERVQAVISSSDISYSSALLRTKGTENKSAVAVPAFCIQDGDKNCYYSLLHSTSGWKHGFKPRLHKIDNNDIDGMITYKVKLTSEIGLLKSIEYIQYEQRNALQVPFFAALEVIIPSVPESALRGAFDLSQQVNNDELIQNAITYKNTIVSRYSLDILASRGVSHGTIATKFKEFKITSDDPRFNTAVSIISQYKNGIRERFSQQQTRTKLKPNTNLLRFDQPRGFLCDKKDLLIEQISSDKVLIDTAKWIIDIRKGEQQPIFANELLRNDQIKRLLPRFIQTKSAIARLDVVTYALRSGVPLLIQGPTSASKSLTVQVASVGLYGQLPLIYALSEQTEVGDFLGRKMLRRKGTSMLSYVPGVLAEAYEKGRVLLLDEYDLCPPKVLSSILSALDGSTIEIEGRKIIRHQNFRVIATLNGETEGFTSQQRNILPSEVLARFHTIYFPLMGTEECNDIFNQLLKKSNPQYENESKQITDVHQCVSNYYTSDQRIDKSRGSATITLRNFSYALDLMVLEKLKPRDACQIAYIAQIPIIDRDKLKQRMDKLGKADNFQKLRDEITQTATEMHIHPHPQFIDAAVYAIIAARNGLHVLLEGPSGCGLSTLARFVANFIRNKKGTKLEEETPIVLLGPESTVENIIGSFKPQEMKSNETDLTKLVKWENGPLLISAEFGTPVILDRIDEAKAQVTERLNPILEKNARRGGTQFLVPERGESTEQQVKEGFVVIATLTTNPNRQTPAISLALRNRFITIAVEPPELKEELQTLFAQIVISNVAEKLRSLFDQTTISNDSQKIKSIKNEELPHGIKPTIPKKDQIKQLSQQISKGLLNTATIRDVALLAHAVCSTYGIIDGLPAPELVALCQLLSDQLTSNMEIFIQRTLTSPKSGQRFFYEGDHKAPMWKSIAALTISSSTGRPLFLQGEPGCGKTEAVRHFSANRTFNSRNPVYSVSCSGETQIEQFIGSLVFEKNGFRFIDGPLVQAARQGCVFLADEFNLLTPAVMITLVPFLSARPGDTFIHPEIKDPITVASGFLFVATGNEDSERGRVKLPQFVDSLLQRLIVKNPSDLEMDGLIEKIIKEDYPNINVQKFQPSAIREFVDKMKDILHIKWSLRDVRRFLRRANDFIGFRPYDSELSREIKPISSTDIALSFILSGQSLDEERKKEMINRTVKIFNGSQDDANSLVQGRTHFRKTYQGNYLLRGHIAMKIEKEALFPQPLMDALFWIRWTGTPDDQIPRENLLLVGQTSYKTTAMQFILPENKNIIHMTREMQISELIGSTSISTPTRFEDSIQNLQLSIRDALISIGYTNKQENGEQLVKDIKSKLENEVDIVEREDEQIGEEEEYQEQKRVSQHLDQMSCILQDQVLLIIIIHLFHLSPLEQLRAFCVNRFINIILDELSRFVSLYL
ncbi:MAG: hypothetical protein EZS28_024715 [Streblomastix strix]|uniref:AAA+ ATPase domain-containing protein n=1 Tax=Streblomastix strix TaxID=222440 RepID=A0A5J4VB01_9EUKA|nr:MAG: hypothetical protein EZS28_024715 [Streblomastix strix]